MALGEQNNKSANNNAEELGEGSPNEAIFDPNEIPDNFQPRYGSAEAVGLHSQVDNIISLLDIDGLPYDARTRLLYALEPYREVTLDEDFNVKEELVMMMTMVKSVRNSILNPNGQLKRETTVPEVKSVLDASMKLSDMINKVNKDLINQERIQAVEASFMDVVNEFPKDQQLQYIKMLERRMKVQKTLQKK